MSKHHRSPSKYIERTEEERDILFHLVRGIARTAVRLPRFTVRDVRLTLAETDPSYALGWKTSAYMAAAFCIARRRDRRICALTKEYVGTASSDGTSRSARVVWASLCCKVKA